MWLVLASYSLCLGTNFYHQTSQSKLQPIKNTQSRVIADQLKKVLEISHSKRAQVLVLDGQTNAIEASVTCRKDTLGNECGEDPSFLEDRWEPGSIFKPILVALMIDRGVIKTDETFSDDGFVVVQGYRIDNNSGHKPAKYDILQFLGTSRNTGAIAILKKLELSPNPEEVWQKSLEHIISHSQGYIPDFNKVRDSKYRFYESSFGVGITITPLRVAQLFNAFQRDGLACDEQNRCLHFVSPGTAKYVQRTLMTVASNYAGLKSAVPRCIYSGKSGTALAAQPDSIYREDVNNGTYVGIITDQQEHKNKLLLVRLNQPSDSLASLPARLGWVAIANQLCQNL